ncbi:hypothetical protein SSCG_04660 [Streptomyces clavuligerus]|nr:hypothetical protein SSCG_04660 [Streptomyces clavuligerus]
MEPWGSGPAGRRGHIGDAAENGDITTRCTRRTPSGSFLPRPCGVWRRAAWSRHFLSAWIGRHAAVPVRGGAGAHRVPMAQ